MFYKGENSGFAFWRYDPASDENSWTLLLGFGGPARRAPREGYLDPHYRFQIRIKWRPLASCFQWWADHRFEVQWLHRKGVHTRMPRVVLQYRVHSFERSPLTLTFGSDARNVYDDHNLVEGDSFWRCDHGYTGFGEGFSPVGCWRCAIWRPIAAVRFRVANRFGGRQSDVRGVWKNAINRLKSVIAGSG